MSKTRLFEERDFFLHNIVQKLRGNEEHILPRNMCGRSHVYASIGGGIHAIVTCRVVRIPVSQLSRRRRKRGRSANGRADGHQPPRPICGRLAWETSGVRCTPSEWERRRATTWTARPWTLCGIRGLDVRQRRTQIRGDNSVRGGGRGETCSRNGAHRGRRPIAVRTEVARSYTAFRRVD